jgi:hypothetical protein
MNCKNDKVLTTISIGEKRYPIREKDLFQFNAWIRSRDITPDLMSKFESLFDYEENMKAAQIRAFETNFDFEGFLKANDYGRLKLPEENNYTKLLNSAIKYIKYELKRKTMDIRVIISDAVSNAIGSPRFNDMLDFIKDINEFYHTEKLAKEGDSLYMMMTRVLDRALHDDLCEEFDDLIEEEEDYMIDDNGGIKE